VDNFEYTVDNFEYTVDKLWITLCDTVPLPSGSSRKTATPKLSLLSPHSQLYRLSTVNLDSILW